MIAARRRFIVRIFLLLFVSLWSVAQTAPVPNTGAATKPVAPAFQPGSKTALPRLPDVGPMQQVAIRETRIRDADLINDVDLMDRLLGKGYVSTGPDGEMLDKPQLLAAMHNREFQYYSMQLSDVQVRAFGPALSIVTGRIDVTGKDKGGDFAKSYRYTRVWQKQARVWKAVAFQATQK
jgi:hypothetical protein